MADKDSKKPSMVDDLVAKAKKVVAEYIEQGTPSVMKAEPRLRAYDDVVNEAVRGRQSTDSSN